MIVSLTAHDAVKKDEEFQASLRDICDDAGRLLLSAKEKGHSRQRYLLNFNGLCDHKIEIVVANAPN